MVILPWPSRRVTGSIVMVWVMTSAPMSLGSKTGESRNVQRFTGYQRCERCVKRVGRGRAAGQEDVDLYELVDGADDAQQLGHHDAGNLLLRVCVLNVGAVQNRFRADGIAHRRNIAGDGAVAHGDQ